jgi:hypothetical protein
MGANSRTTEVNRVQCKDEDKELQSLLESNLNILPGDQISPGQNLRWLLVKREMPVVNPSTGENLWSIDFLLVDQNGVPTLVECKRRNDTRSRREIVGQMLEYAASGRYYWTASDFRSQAQSTAGNESILSQKLKALGTEMVAEEFFAVMERNLQRSKMRLIFLLDDSPLELRSIVEFLNAQTKDTEVLIVEARQYEHNGTRIVVPWVFGFTEEARVAKRESRAEATRSSPTKGEDAFWEAIEATTLGPEVKDDIREFVSKARGTRGCNVRWLATCMIDLPDVVPQRTLLSIGRNGSIQLNLACWRSKDDSPLSATQSAAQQDFFNELHSMFKFSKEDLETKQYPAVASEEWIPNANKLSRMIERLAGYSSQTTDIVGTPAS